MKKFTFLILFAFTTLAFSQDFQVTNTGIGSVDIPSLDVYNGNVYLTYGTNYLFYKFPDTGPSAPIDNGIQPSPSAWGPYNANIAVSKVSGFVYSSFIDPIFSPTTKFQLHNVVSNDGGDNWNYLQMVDDIQNGNSLSTRYDVPKLFCSDSGNVYNVWFDFTTDTDTAGLYISRNNGLRIRIDEPNFTDYESAVSTDVVSYPTYDSVYLTYFMSGKFYFATINFSNGNWGMTLNEIVDLGNVFMQYDNYSKIIIDGNGNLNFFYNYYNSNGTFLTKSSDNGITWSTPQKIYSSSIPFENPYLSINITSDNTFVMLTHISDGNIYVSSSSDAINWSSPIQVNSEDGTVTDESFMNSVLIDDSHVSTAWIDTRTGNEEIFYANVLIPDTPTDVKDKDDTLPVKFKLLQNYPNPFNPSTTINYSIPMDKTQNIFPVRLKIYDVTGKEVAVLVNENKSAGNYSVNFDASNLTSGTYFYRLDVGNYTAVKKMVLMK